VGAAGGRLVGCLTLVGFATAEASGADREVVQRNISYLPEAKDTSHQLDLYLPKAGTSGKRPLLVWIHGGGWAGGDKNDLREQQIGRRLADEGYVVASINYSLASDEHPTWPKAVFDCKNAIRFLRRNAAQWKIDPDRICVGGGSAGAHLALMVAYTHGIPEMTPATPYEGERDDVKAVMSFYGATNFLTMQTTDREGRPTGKPVAGRSITRFLGQDRITGEAFWKEASPVTHVRPGIPATYLSHGKKDTTIDYLQSVELHDLLKKTGIPCEMVLLENTEHTYSFTHRGKAPLEKDLTPGILAFLNQHLPATDSTDAIK
jgi:acetyl esterase/lipase